MFNDKHGMSIKQMVARETPPANSAGINYTVTQSLSPEESHRNWGIQRWLSTKNFMGNVVTRVALPHDNEHSQGARELEQRRQLAQPWENVFMRTPTDGNRLNNPSQESFLRQRRLNPGSTYGAFYAFMHALSAAFGTLGNE